MSADTNADGPPKARIPPPPRLVGLSPELSPGTDTAEPEASSAATAGSDLPQPSDPAAPTDADDTEAGASENSGNRKPPALPRPGKLGVSRNVGDFRDAPRDPGTSSSSGTSSIPKGIKPPSSASAVPGEVESENTDVLIASVADAIASEAEAREAEAATSRAAAGSSTGLPAPPTSVPDAALVSTVSVGEADLVDPSPSSPQPAWLPWAAVGGVVAIVVFALLAWPSEDDEAGPAPPAAKMEPPSVAAAGAAAPTPEPEVAPADNDEPVEGAAADDDPAAGDFGDSSAEGIDEAVAVLGEDTEDDQALHDEQALHDDPALEGEQPAGDDSATTDEPKSRGSKKNGRKKSVPASTSEPAPKPKPHSGSGDSASQMLASAKAELSKGRAREAYRLASASYRKAKNTSALQVMARAACRIGSQSKAKYAFDKLSVSQRSGIRAECRKKGIRLGI